MVETTGFESHLHRQRGDWPHHLATLQGLLVHRSPHHRPLHKGDPRVTQLKLPFAPDHFELWLALFAETAFPPDLATSVIAKSQRIARNFKNGIAFQRRQPP
jgi:hemoglobin